MHIVKLTVEQLEQLARAVSYAQTQRMSFRAAFDPIHESIKFKVGNLTWSPPLKTEEW